MEDFVTFELAVKLREKGFREDCIAYYHTDGELIYNSDEYRGGDYRSLLMSYNSLPKNPIGCEQIDAPVISQVLKWLRKEKDIYITIFIDDDSDIPVTYEIYKGSECVCTHQGEYFALKDWSKCELRAIEYVLDNLI